ncbi:MAG TPA: DUF169 domain-containing protein [Acidimicrobiales bacterium]|nr:DUF169 domain-containing protein [Acidimicrobiales bacterium]
MPGSADWKALADRLTGTLHLTTAPIGIAFSSEAPPDVPAFDAPMPSPSPDGRTGRVPAGCVFWVHAAAKVFTTETADHGNCSVGSFTHGLRSAEEVAGNGDVAALVGSGWAPETLLSVLPQVSGRPSHVTYGPLASFPGNPDVVMIRLNGKQLMVLSDAEPDMLIEGKPQCHIIPLARERQQVAASVGCMLSRVRTGMPSTEMTCAIPAARLAEVVEKLERTNSIDSVVAQYASEDAVRFG